MFWQVQNIPVIIHDTSYVDYLTTYDWLLSEEYYVSINCNINDVRYVMLGSGTNNKLECNVDNKEVLIYDKEEDEDEAINCKPEENLSSIKGNGEVTII